MHHDATRFLNIGLLATAAILSAGCSDAAPTLTAPEVSRTASVPHNCNQVLVQTNAAIGPVEVAPGVYTIGALPFPTTIAGVNGMLGSVVTGLDPSGKLGQGAQHLTLVHFFVSEQGTFTTTDRAVCAPAGTDAGTCRVNDVLTVSSGTGVFAGAQGSLRNHGIIDFNTNALSVSLRGRICTTGA